MQGGASGASRSGEAGASGTTGNAGAAGATCTPSAAPDEPDDAFEDTNCDGIDGDKGGAIFVAGPSGDDTQSGAFGEPVKTIRRGIELAQGAGKKAVYVCSGVYEEALVLAGDQGAVSLYGGYNCLGESRPWRRNDGDNVLVQPPGGVPLLVQNVLEAVTIDRFNFQGPDAAGGGAVAESSYAVQVLGSRLVRFRHTDLAAGAGAEGDDGAKGDDGAGALACNGLSDCGSGASGGDGPSGASTGQGSFHAAGFTPGLALSGGDGALGGHGTAPPTTAQAPQSKCTITGGDSCDVTTGPVAVPPGRCGCGGGRGRGGRGGRGGGASVGLFASGASTSVVLEASQIRGGVGGKGGAGGPGGVGTEGTFGAPGPDTSYTKRACKPPVCPPDDPGCGPPICGTSGSGVIYGAPGGKGGAGGKGGTGGSGAGGMAYAVVTVGGATVDASDAVLLPGTGGLGGPGAPSGDAGTVRAF